MRGGVLLTTVMTPAEASAVLFHAKPFASGGSVTELKFPDAAAAVKSLNESPRTSVPERLVTVSAPFNDKLPLTTKASLVFGVFEIAMSVLLAAASVKLLLNESVAKFGPGMNLDRKSTRLNSSHLGI